MEDRVYGNLQGMHGSMSHNPHMVLMSTMNDQSNMVRNTPNTKQKYEKSIFGRWTLEMDDELVRLLSTQRTNFIDGKLPIDYWAEVIEVMKTRFPENTIKFEKRSSVETHFNNVIKKRYKIWKNLKTKGVGIRWSGSRFMLDNKDYKDYVKEDLAGMDVSEVKILDRMFNTDDYKFMTVYDEELAPYLVEKPVNISNVHNGLASSPLSGHGSPPITKMIKMVEQNPNPQSKRRKVDVKSEEIYQILEKCVLEKHKVYKKSEAILYRLVQSNLMNTRAYLKITEYILDDEKRSQYLLSRIENSTSDPILAYFIKEFMSYKNLDDTEDREDFHDTSSNFQSANHGL